jgi:hypothetical protein
MEIKFPHISVQLTGEDGNAFMIIGRVQRAMRRGGCTQDEISAFAEEATSGDYDHVLVTAMQTVDVL